MKLKQKIKMILDIFMTGLLLALMAYQITGQVFHEWFGAGMLVLFLAHNILNVRWYAGLFKGKYTALRIVQTLINLCVLTDMLCLGYSGMVLSRHVFAALPINGPLATARVMHLAASYWGFVLMSVHLGLHWGMVLGMLRITRLKTGGQWIARLAAIAVAGYGAYCFYQNNIGSYMFLKAQFVFFDFEKSAVSVFAEYMAMMALWIFVGYYAAKGLRSIR